VAATDYASGVLHAVHALLQRSMQRSAFIILPPSYTCGRVITITFHPLPRAQGSVTINIDASLTRHAALLLNTNIDYLQPIITFFRCSHHCHIIIAQAAVPRRQPVSV